MPEHNGIRIALVSQYDALLIPEYQCPDYAENPATKQIVDTYVPNYAASQFWTRYTCDVATQEPETRFFYFKLYAAGEFAVAWGCGEQDGWKGKTLFVPSDASSNGRDGNTNRDKLGLFFPHEIEETSEVPALEIRVFRTKARMRQERRYSSKDASQSMNGGVQLNSIGMVKRRDPRRYYSYALLDPKDEPYATFRYHIRAQDQLQSGGFVRRQHISSKRTEPKESLVSVDSDGRTRETQPVSPMELENISQSRASATVPDDAWY